MITLTLATPTVPDEALSADNTVGAEFIDNVVAAHRGPVDGSDVEKVQFFMKVIKRWLVETNHAQKKKAGREQSDATIDATKTDFS